MGWNRWLLAAGFLGVLNGPVLADPSFDCAKARLPAERAICADPLLARTDSLIARAFRTYEPPFRPKQSIVRDLLEDRNRCGDDRACIAGILAESLNTYSGDNPSDLQAEPWVADHARALYGLKASNFRRNRMGYAGQMPAQPGQCVRTKVAEITTRFGEPLQYDNEDMGTAIGFENGGYNVSYGRDGIYQTKAGDDVIVCLMSIPRDCPPGDDRGRTYFALNAVNSEYWVMADSQHRCGGA